MTFSKEADFENALIRMLTESFGWEPQVLQYKTEKELLKNWANILFENNRSIDRLNDYPLTDGEMQQIIEQIETLKTPLKLNGFINGRTILPMADIQRASKISFSKMVSTALPNIKRWSFKTLLKTGLPLVTTISFTVSLLRPVSPKP